MFDKVISVSFFKESEAAKLSITEYLINRFPIHTEDWGQWESVSYSRTPQDSWINALILQSKNSPSNAPASILSPDNSYQH